jgi:hypothetical protein
MFNKSLATAAAASTFALMATSAYATTTAYTNVSAFQTAGLAGVGGTQVADQVNWATFAAAIGTPANNGTIAYQSAMTTAALETITVTNSSGIASKLPFTTYTEGLGSWDGDFNAGTTILYNGNNQTTTLTFASLLSGVGVDLQTQKTGNYTFTLTAYDISGNVLGTSVDTGTTSFATTAGNTSKEGTVTFVGLTSTAANISYVTLSSSNDNSGFAIDTSLIYHNNLVGQTQQTQQTPEPGTLALLGAGLLGLGWARRRHKAA